MSDIVKAPHDANAICCGECSGNSSASSPVEQGSFSSVDDKLLGLLARARAGDGDAWSMLYSEYDRGVRAVVRRFIQNGALCEDVCQDVWSAAYRFLDQLIEPQRFPGWLKTISCRMALNARRREYGNSPTHALPAFDWIPDFHADSDPTVSIITMEHQEQIHRMLSMLQKHHPEIIATARAFYFDGQSVNQIAATFNVPMGTIKRRLFTAREKLRGLYENLGLL